MVSTKIPYGQKWSSQQGLQIGGCFFLANSLDSSSLKSEASVPYRAVLPVRALTRGKYWAKSRYPEAHNPKVGGSNPPPATNIDLGASPPDPLHTHSRELASG